MGGQFLNFFPFGPHKEMDKHAQMLKQHIEINNRGDSNYMLLDELTCRTANASHTRNRSSEGIVEETLQVAQTINTLNVQEGPK